MRPLELSPGLGRLCAVLEGRVETIAPAEEGALIALARRHRVEPLLHVRLAGRTDVLAADYRANAERVLRTQTWLSRLLRALAAQGIEARPLKGLPLAAQAFTRVADRHCGDLDLLIDADVRERADHCLLDLGMRPRSPRVASASGRALYRALYKEDGYVTPDGLLVELHYRQGIGRHLFPAFLGFASEAWETWRLDSVATHRLHGAALLLYLLSHGTRSGWHRLKWLLDLRQLTRGFDSGAWGVLEEAAQRENLMAQVSIGLRMLHATFGMPAAPAHMTSSEFVFRECLRGLNGEARSSRTVLQEAGNAWYSVLVQSGWRARAAVATRSIIRVRDVERLRLPLPLVVPLALLVRPFSVFCRHAIRRRQ